MESLHGGDIYEYDDVLDFSSNVNPLKMPVQVIKSIQKAIDSIHLYPDDKVTVLRENIAKKYKLKKENVICGNGAADLIYRFVFAIKPKKALLLAPTFAEYEQALNKIPDVILDYYYMNSTDFTVNADLLDKIDESFDVIFICNPNNPTGKLADYGLLEKILVKCQANNIKVFIDECFMDFVEEKESLISKINDFQNLVILKAFTKMYGLAGLRLGYAISKDAKLLEDMKKIWAPWSVNIVAIKAGISALQDETWEFKTRKYIAKEKLYFEKMFEQIGIKYFKSDVNFYLIKHEKNLKEKMLEKGILIRDCSNFHNLSKGYYRLSINMHEENVKLFEAFEEIERQKIDG